VRVMRTCGMMGEVVGKAAYLCVLRQTTPRNIYDSYLPDLIELLKQPGAMRRCWRPTHADWPAGHPRPSLEP